MKLAIQPRSIAFRLIVAVLAVELVSSILVVVLSFGYERHIHFRAFDVMLHGRADSILGAVQDAEDPGDNVMLDKADLHIPPDDVYEVYDEAGHLLGRSDNWQGAGPGVPTHSLGDFSQIRVSGHHYRILRIQGSRTIDPGEHGGGKLRKVTIVYGSPTFHAWHAVRGAVEFYAAGSIILLIVTGPLIAWLLHRGLLPLRQLASLASQVSVDAWQFTPPASAYSTPELAPLTHAIESVLQRLEQSFIQQRAFVSDAAHELKTAVAVIKSSLQLLTMKRRSAQEYQAGLERCLADSLRLEAIVADMLTLARAESSAPVDGPQSTANLPACIDQVVVQLETVAAHRNVQVNTTVSNSIEAFEVALAPEACTLLLSNLLLNAIQHSLPASAVEIILILETEENAPTAVVQIQDHGDGIPLEALSHVFDRFYRGDPSRARTTGGTGLGLAISKAIVTKAGGSISIASQPDPALPDQGTAVIVRLPISRYLRTAKAFSAT
jgi:signal transduction histidine kinase